MICPDCDRPIATNADSLDPILNPDDGEGSDTLCWRHWNQGDACDGTPIDWRARCKAAEALVVEVGVLRAVNASNELSIDMLIRECEERYQAHRDAQAMLEEVAAERDAQIEATVCERELWEIFADCRWEEVWARDAALEACQERIAGLLNERTLLVAAFDEARENAPRALTDALADIMRIAGERDQARRQVATLQATVLGLLAVLQPLDPAHVEVLRGVLQSLRVEARCYHAVPMRLTERIAALQAVPGVADE